MEKIVEKFQALAIGEKIILVAGVVLFIAAFLPWYSISLEGFGTFSRSGWQSPGALWSILAVFIGLAMSGAITLKTFTDVKLPDDIAGQSWAKVHLGAGSVSLLLVIIKFINEGSFLGFGFYLGLLAAAALAAGGFLMFKEEGVALPSLSSVGSASGEHTPEA